VTTAAIRVLVVDDAADLRAIVRIVLELEDDFDVVGEASSGEDAVRLARELRPDLVVLDVAMPGMDGLDALSAMRDVAPGAKIVMFSAHDSARTVDRARRRGAAGYIDKTTGVVDLVGRLREICLPE
jgi:DNA-binding NarL/FixJ family response regulator